ncbi:MAG: hypothetical protein WDM90_10860 [Ferruginibacter sp.]
MSHKADAVAKYRAKVAKETKESRAILSFVKEFHGAGSVEEMFAEAKKKDLTPQKRKVAIELEQYPESLCLLRIASSIFRHKMPSILRKSSTSSEKKFVRDVLCYVMHTDLGMSRDDIAIFLGYSFPPVVSLAVENIAQAYIENEDVILAVDLLRNEYRRTYQAEVVE